MQSPVDHISAGAASLSATTDPVSVPRGSVPSSSAKPLIRQLIALFSVVSAQAVVLSSPCPCAGGLCHPSLQPTEFTRDPHPHQCWQILLRPGVCRAAGGTGELRATHGKLESNNSSVVSHQQRAGTASSGRERPPLAACACPGSCELSWKSNAFPGMLPPPWLPARLPLQPPLHTSRIPCHGSVAHTTPQTLPVPVPGFGPCGKRAQRGQSPASTALDEPLWGVVACPPSCFNSPAVFSTPAGIAGTGASSTTSLIPPGVSHAGCHPLSPSSQESERSWKLCCCLLE